MYSESIWMPLETKKINSGNFSRCTSSLKFKVNQKSIRWKRQNFCCFLFQSCLFIAIFDFLYWNKEWCWKPLSACLNFSTSAYPKRIQIPHSSFRDFRADKTLTTRWSGARLQVWVQVWVPACHLAITPNDYSRRKSKDLTAKSMAELLGTHSGTAWAGQNS